MKWSNTRTVPWTVNTLTGQFGVEQKGFSPGELQAIRHLLHQKISVFSQVLPVVNGKHLWYL